MNFGQLYEMHLAFALQTLKTNMLKLIVNQDEVKKYLLEFIKIIDKTNGGWYYDQLEKAIPKTITKEFIDDFTIIQPPFESCKLEDLQKAMEYTGASFTSVLFDPLSQVKLENEIAVGYIYFFRMVHIAEEKLAARGIGAYARRTLQPLGGRKNKGGQRCGEMETACLIGHDAPCNLFEFLTTKSDCIDLKNSYIRNFIGSNLIEDTKDLDTVPESVKLLNSYLTVIGVNHK
jgi:DNA-directed RNA polymerase subunit beta